MRGGRLRHLVTLQRRVDTTVDGSTTTAWPNIGKVWGAVEPVRGREALNGGGVLAEMDTRIVLRYDSVSSQLTARDRILWDGVYYNIYSIAELRTAGRELEVLARSGVNDG